jgi:predicted nuclease with TOPRIM domain
MEDTELRNRLWQIDNHLVQVDTRFDKVDARLAEVDARFDKVHARFAEVDARFDKMERLILQEGERTRMHFDAVAEGLEDRIKLVAEGDAALRMDVTELKDGQQHLLSEQSRLDVHILAVASRVVSLDSRITGVEKIQKIILAEVRGLATKVDRLSNDDQGFS